MGKPTKIKIGFPTFIFFAAFLLLNFSPYTLVPFFCALMHEAGHIIAMKFSGINIQEITILPFGIDIKKQSTVTSYKTDIIITGAGIFVNFLLFIISLLFFKGELKSIFILSNFLLILINILPIRTLDGGQMVEKIVACKYGIPTSEKVINCLSFFCILLLGSVAIWLLLYSSYNFTLLFMCIYLFCCIFVK